jgi:site-specific recombinase XerD
MNSFSWVLDEGKFLTKKEVRKLRFVVEKRKEEALRKRTKTAIRDWIVINLALFTGLRVKEISDLSHEDLIMDNGNSSLIVRNGKNGKSRVIKFGSELREHLLEYINWKENLGEPCNENDPLIVSSYTNEAMTTRGIQKIFERNAKRAGIKGHSIHHLRHTYASHLYKASKYNLRLVQKQLGHSSIKVTEIYADVLRPDLDRAVRNLYGG